MAAGLLLLLALLAWWRFGRATEVATTTVQTGEVALRVSGPGTLQAKSTVQLAARLGSRIEAVLADVGDSVHSGQLLVELDDREAEARLAALRARQSAVNQAVTAGRATLARAEAEHELAKSLQLRDLELASKGHISRSAIDIRNASLKVAMTSVDAAQAGLDSLKAEARSLAAEVDAAAVALSYTQLYSPLTGLVTQRLAEPGDTVSVGSVILTLVDPSTLWVATRVDESVLAHIEIGQEAQIRLRSGAEMGGRVARIARQSDAATRELDVFVAFDATPDQFAMDQEAQVTIQAGRAKGLVVPVTALTRNTEGVLGVLVVESGRTRFQQIATDAIDEHLAEVVQGVEAGEIVITDAKGVRANQSVRSVPAR